MKSTIVLLLTLLGYIHFGASSEVPFRYYIEERHHAVEGHVADGFSRGSRVRAVLPEEVTEEVQKKESAPIIITEKFLQVVPTLRKSKHRKTTRDFSISMVTTPSVQPHGNRITQRNRSPFMETHRTRMHEDPTTEPVAARFLSTLIDSFKASHPTGHPTGHHTGPPPPPHRVNRRAAASSTHTPIDTTQFKFVVEDTTAFRIDDSYFVVVDNVTALEGHEQIDFYVYLADRLTNDSISNPLPFLVHIGTPESIDESDDGEESDSGYPTLPAVFAGVLVLIVLFFALFIPLVTRAKRRYKEGKPMFKPGSHPSTNDLQKLEAASLGSGGMSRMNSEPNWYGPNNVYYNYQEEVDREKSAFTSDMKHYTQSQQNETPTLQLTKKKKTLFKQPVSETSSSGVETDIPGGGAEGSFSQRL